MSSNRSIASNTKSSSFHSQTNDLATDTTLKELKTSLQRLEFNGNSLKVENQNNIDISGLAKETTLHATNLVIGDNNSKLDTANTTLGLMKTQLINVNDNIGTTNTELITINNSLTSSNTALNNVNYNITTTNTKLDTIDSSINTKIDTTNNKIDTTNTKLDTTNTKLDTTNNKLDTTNNKLNTIDTDLNTFSAKFFHATQDPEAIKVGVSGVVSIQGDVSVGNSVHISELPAISPNRDGILSFGKTDIGDNRVLQTDTNGRLNVNVANLPTTQQISGEVMISNLGSTNGYLNSIQNSNTNIETNTTYLNAKAAETNISLGNILTTAQNSDGHLNTIDSSTSSINSKVSITNTALSGINTLCDSIENKIVTGNNSLAVIGTNTADLNVKAAQSNINSSAILTTAQSSDNHLNTINSNISSINSKATLTNDSLGYINTKCESIDIKISTGNASLNSIDTKFTTNNNSLASIDNKLTTNTSGSAPLTSANALITSSSLDLYYPSLNRFYKAECDRATASTNLLTYDSRVDTKLTTTNNSLSSIDTKATTTNTSLVSVDGKMTTGNNSLASIDTKATTTNTSLASIDGKMTTTTNSFTNRTGLSMYPLLTKKKYIQMMCDGVYSSASSANQMILTPASSSFPGNYSLFSIAGSHFFYVYAAGITTGMILNYDYIAANGTEGTGSLTIAANATWYNIGQYCCVNRMYLVSGGTSITWQLGAGNIYMCSDTQSLNNAIGMLSMYQYNWGIAVIPPNAIGYLLGGLSYTPTATDNLTIIKNNTSGARQAMYRFYSISGTMLTGMVGNNSGLGGVWNAGEGIYFMGESNSVTNRRLSATLCIEYY